MKRAVRVTHMQDRKAAYRGLVRKSEGKRALGSARRRWKDNIKVGLQEMCWGDMDWIAVSQIGRELL